MVGARYVRPRAGVAKLADAAGLAPASEFSLWGFESPHPHHVSIVL